MRMVRCPFCQAGGQDAQIKSAFLQDKSAKKSKTCFACKGTGTIDLATADETVSSRVYLQYAS